MQSRYAIDTKLIFQNKYACITIGADLPYQVLTAMPLISCYAYIFRYRCANKSEKAIMLHAGGGLPSPAIMVEICHIIEEDVETNQVEVLIAMPDRSNTASEIETLNQAKADLQVCGFDLLNNVKIIAEMVPSYCIDSVGRHGPSADQLVLRAVNDVYTCYLRDLAAQVNDPVWDDKGVDILGRETCTPKNILVLRNLLQALPTEHMALIERFEQVRSFIQNIPVSFIANVSRRADVSKFYLSLQTNIREFESSTPLLSTISVPKRAVGI